MQRGPQSRVMVEGSALAARRLRPERPRVPTACQGGSERPCSGNGQCSGDGSRQGDGSCQCHVGYRGPLCTDCVDGYFSSLRNETHSICTGAAGGRGELLPGAGVRGWGAAGAATTDGLGAVSLPVPKHAPGRQRHFPPVHPVLVLCGLAPAVVWLRLALPQGLAWQAGRPRVPCGLSLGAVWGRRPNAPAATWV